MTNLERMKLRVPEEANDAVFLDCLESAKNAILARRFPYGDFPTKTVTNSDGTTSEETYIESRYLDLQYRIAMDLYNKAGAEGETSHSENGISRMYESSWISKQLLDEVVPKVGVV